MYKELRAGGREGVMRRRTAGEVRVARGGGVRGVGRSSELGNVNFQLNNPCKQQKEQWKE